MQILSSSICPPLLDPHKIMAFLEPCNFLSIGEFYKSFKPLHAPSLTFNEHILNHEAK